MIDKTKLNIALPQLKIPYIFTFSCSLKRSRLRLVYKVKKAIGNSSHNIFSGKLSNKLLSVPNTIRKNATTEQKTIDNQNIAVNDFVNPSFPSLKNATEK